MYVWLNYLEKDRVMSDAEELGGRKSDREGSGKAAPFFTLTQLPKTSLSHSQTAVVKIFASFIYLPSEHLFLPHFDFSLSQSLCGHHVGLTPQELHFTPTLISLFLIYTIYLYVYIMI